MISLFFFNGLIFTIDTSGGRDGFLIIAQRAGFYDEI